MSITLRQASVVGAVTAGRPLTYAEMDANFGHILDFGITFKQHGAVADATGVTGVGTDNTSAIQAALDAAVAAGVTCYGPPGIYRVTSTIDIDSGLKLVMDPSCVIFFDCDLAGTAWMLSSGWASETDLSKVWIEGGEIRGRSDWSGRGIGLRMNCDDFTWKDTVVRYFGNNGQVAQLCGDRMRVSGIKGLDPYLTGTASGGIRIVGGNDIIVSDCHVNSDDDVFQLVPLEPTAANDDLSISNAHFINCTGNSYHARIGIVALSDLTASGTMTASITDWSFVGVSGQAPQLSTATSAAFAVYNQDSTGTVARGAFVGCHADGSLSQGQGFYIENSYTGTVTDIDMIGCTVSGQYSSGLTITFLTGTGSVLPKGINWIGGFIGGPRVGTQPSVNIKEGQKIVVRDARLVGPSGGGNQVVSVGNNGTDCPNVTIEGCRIEDIGTGATTRYGVSWAKCSRGRARGNVMIGAASTSAARGHNIAAASSNITIQDEDFSGLTASASTFINPIAGCTEVRAINNRGFVTRNSGTGSVASGATSSGNIAHGLSVTPTAEKFNIIPTATTTNDVGGWPWINTIGATNFKVDVRADPGASGFAFSWRVNAEKLA